MKAAKECCRRTFCARSLIFMASASIIFWNELIKRTKTTADAVVFSIKMWRAQQRRLGKHSRNGIIQSRRSAHWKCRGVDNPKGRGFAPPFWSLGVQGRSRNAPAVVLGVKGGHSLTRANGPLIPCSAYGAASPCLWHKKELPLPRELFSLFFNTALRRRGCGDRPSANGAFLRRFRDARRR